jgi:hypothetical protein
MKAYLINPELISIEEVEIEENSDGEPQLDHIRGLIGCSWIDVARLTNSTGDVIYVDDEGMLKDGNELFGHEEYYSPLAGIGIVLGTDNQGNTIAPTVTLEQLKNKVCWFA